MASPNSSLSPISIGWSVASSSSSRSSVSSGSSTCTTWALSSLSQPNNSLACAFPSWPSGNTLSPTLSALQKDNVPSSYISDFDLFPDDLEDENAVPYLEEAPAPPREYPARQLPLPPLYAPERPKSTSSRRRRSSKKQKPAKPMTPIAESPLAESPRAPE